MWSEANSPLSLDAVRNVEANDATMVLQARRLPENNRHETVEPHIGLVIEPRYGLPVTLHER